MQMLINTFAALSLLPTAYCMKRKCPNCGEKSIDTNDFKLGVLTRCSNCHAGVEVDTFSVVSLSIILAFLCGFFFNQGEPSLGLFFLGVLALRVISGDRLDSLFLPLRPNLDE